MHINHDDIEIYKKLQEQLDKMPLGYPKTGSGAEIRILQHLFSPQEAEICLNLNILPENVKRIYRRVRKAGIDISIDALAGMLDDLAQRGAILFEEKNGKMKYSYALFAIGMFEFQVDRMTRDFFDDCEQYLVNEFGKEFHSVRLPQMRAVPVGKSITPEHHVATYDDMRDAIDKVEGQFSVVNCVCKQGMDLLDKHCKTTDIRDTCIMFPQSTPLYEKFGSARHITKEEALQLLERAEDAGLVIQPTNSQNPVAICCCCGCCCGILTSAKKFPKPAELFNSNYYAVVTDSLCKGCGLCLKKCQMEAITIENKQAIINYDRCIGCGLCVPVCPTDAVELIKKSQQYKPPANTLNYYLKVLRRRIGTMRLVKAGIKLFFGQKV